MRNVHNQPHNFHIHDVQFQVFELNGAPPPLASRGWKDTVFLPPGTAATLIVPFGRYGDPHMPYMFHCHLIWHEREGMMGQFVIVDPGQSASATLGEMPATHAHE